jgi:hypothetical protein
VAVIRVGDQASQPRSPVRSFGAPLPDTGHGPERISGQLARFTVLHF